MQEARWDKYNIFLFLNPRVISTNDSEEKSFAVDKSAVDRHEAGDFSSLRSLEMTIFF